MKGERLQLTKKETANFQLWQKVARKEETEEQNNSLLTVMAQRGQKRRAEETEERRNRGLSDMTQRSQERRAEENRRKKEWPIGQTRRVTRPQGMTHYSR
ncbi:hypothetical protein AVEN_167669-1 [Araneus ventricosus]|uniref:Uncharacterized protein n=1 Tax=Araneus ventricosus TaxID=182803 RepID=A0A4Y2UWC4_ARAVE|nr:hypothetical protein AVEN_167669-1 [Araneus ventricosus]